MKREIDQINEMWQGLSREDRGKLLESLGFNNSWAICETINEIGTRGGAFVAKDLIKVIKRKLDL